MVDAKMIPVIASVLFFVLAPGYLLSIPPVRKADLPASDTTTALFMPARVTLANNLVHAFVFFFVLKFLLKNA